MTTKNSFNHDRRLFLIYMLVSAGSLITGCAMRVPSKIKSMTSGFRIYNGFNPNIRHKQHQTWHQNATEFNKVEWAGTQYQIGLNEPVIAPARGKIWAQYSQRGYHGLEGVVEIMHGGGFMTRLFHMQPRSCPYKQGKVVERGTKIGRTSVKMGLKTSMEFGHIFGDLDDYGHNLSYMKAWDGSQLDHEFDQVDKRAHSHKKLIEEFRSKYVGPGKEQLTKTGHGVPLVLSHDNKGRYLWSLRTFFKLLENIYNSHPELYNGTKNENDRLIEDIYSTQPMILTLPLKA